MPVSNNVVLFGFGFVVVFCYCCWGGGVCLLIRVWFICLIFVFNVVDFLFLFFIFICFWVI